MMRYVFGGSDVMTQGLKKIDILTEQYKISLTMNEKEEKNKDRIKM